jgi:hypothetical protein
MTEGAQTGPIDTEVNRIQSPRQTTGSRIERNFESKHSTVRQYRKEKRDISNTRKRRITSQRSIFNMKTGEETT